MKLCHGLLLALATLALCDRVKGQSNRFDISIHVIDTGKGSGANEAPVKLYKSKSNDDWLLVSQGKTGASGRLTDFTSSTLKFTKGIYKFTVGAKDYYSAAGQETLFPVIDIIFNIDDTNQHYHIPLLLNAYGYSTYRGS
ncbi:probable 5-hydroxyisourate hydrolase R09H10.3 [Nasonia vitripennis]|uniref:5-hydroxyisourate hydrolase n=1 Tax=Nasonia vitripennis TaxID=7425 RepID=A0A7M7Q3D7_NASVI|nr:probable 5-hydroxyisourate hydrolase R09H10.3 [Nasonia vitripennis]